MGKGCPRKIWVNRVRWIKKFSCVHLNRSSSVLAMMAAIFGGDAGTMEGTVGWVCYFVAITKYLIIALITSTDKAGDLLGNFDRAVAEQREELIEEFSEKKDDQSPKSFSILLTKMSELLAIP